MADFFAMGGHAFYVWGSFGVSALFIIVEIVMVKQRRRTILQRLSRIMRIKAEEAKRHET
ncbi:MAG: heme exporter protein CcmD [Gammaproteobacteria bacterium]|nr:heme exporter protein CcmD [Gammaproteobacteria bacterium]